RQSPFRARGIARAAFCKSCCSGGGRKGRGRHIGSGHGLSCGRGRFRLRLRRRRRCTRFFRGRGRPRHMSLFGGRERFRLRLRKRCHYTGFFGGRGRPRYVSLFGGQGHGERGRSPHIGLFLRRRFFVGRGLGGRGRPPHIPHIGILEVGGGPGLIADDAFGAAEQIYSDIPVIWLKARAAQVRGSDLQGIEQ